VFERSKGALILSTLCLRLNFSRALISIKFAYFWMDPCWIDSIGDFKWMASVSRGRAASRMPARLFSVAP
jgi:hypothetical protein